MSGALRDVLDHGSVQLIEAWGSDERIIEAARMSTGKGFQGWGPTDVGPCSTCDGTGHYPPRAYSYSSCPDSLDRTKPEWCERGRRMKAGDERLLAYLWAHKHATPFEMAGAVIEVKAPIFVFREWHRHRTQSYNEMSARYTPLPDENYVPTVERLLVSGGPNKQASGTTGFRLTSGDAEGFQMALALAYEAAERTYQGALERGVSKELARLVLPVGRYSRMRASANLRNWLAFLTLRMDAAAQWEIRQYANAVGEIIAALYPRTWALFVEGRAA